MGTRGARPFEGGQICKNHFANLLSPDISPRGKAAAKPGNVNGDLTHLVKTGAGLV